MKKNNRLKWILDLPSCRTHQCFLPSNPYLLIIFILNPSMLWSFRRHVSSVGKQLLKIPSPPQVQRNFERKKINSHQEPRVDLFLLKLGMIGRPCIFFRRKFPSHCIA